MSVDSLEAVQLDTKIKYDICSHNTQCTQKVGFVFYIQTVTPSSFGTPALKLILLAGL